MERATDHFWENAAPGKAAGAQAMHKVKKRKRDTAKTSTRDNDESLIAGRGNQECDGGSGAMAACGKVPLPQEYMYEELQYSDCPVIDDDTLLHVGTQDQIRPPPPCASLVSSLPSL